MMAKKVAAEGEKEEELFDKFMCYCETSGKDLEKSIDDTKTKATQLESDIKEAQGLRRNSSRSSISIARTARTRRPRSRRPPPSARRSTPPSRPRTRSPTQTLMLWAVRFPRLRRAWPVPPSCRPPTAVN